MGYSLDIPRYLEDQIFLSQLSGVNTPKIRPTIKT